MRWLELTVEADGEAIEAISEIFGRLGRGAAVRPTRLITDAGDEQHAREDPSAPYELTVHIPESPDAPAAVDRTQRALWHLQAFGLRPIGELRVRAVDEQDWANAWRVGYQPQRIGRLVVVPSWLNEAVASGEVELRLDPGMAFGTGLHPSTRGCLTLLQRAPVSGAVLDVGSGSGILAIAALKLGAERAVCLDTDPVAVETTLANAERNGLAGRVSATLGTLAEAAEDVYPLIFANLVATVLVELSERLAAHLAPGGRLLAAGIIATRADEVEAAMAAAGLVPVDRLDEDDWVTLQLTLSPVGRVT